MSKVLKGIYNVVMYCDELFVHTRTRKGQLVALDNILASISEFGIKIAPRKCKFMLEKLTFLGYKISWDGMMP